MNCPVCKEVMIVLELNNVEIDYCPECGGIWLDEGELEALLEDGEKKERLLKSMHVNNSVKEKKRKCPICGKAMDKVFCGYLEKKVLIDRCPKMHGIWFDKNELEEVIKLGTIDEEGKTIKLLKDIFGN